MSKGVHLPKVSIIVPVYNQEKYIGRCLRSLLRQTMPSDDYEIIVINDGSTDKTPYALDLFHNAIIRIDNKCNLGLPASINIGIKKSRSSYIIRVDSDDYVNENFINFLFLYMETNPQVDSVACDYYLVDDCENILERVNSELSPIACGIIFRKAQLLEIGLYDESFRWHEERELRIRYEKKYRINRLDIPLYRYRRHTGNLTNNLSEMAAHDRLLNSKHDPNKN